MIQTRNLGENIKTPTPPLRSWGFEFFGKKFRAIPGERSIPLQPGNLEDSQAFLGRALENDLFVILLLLGVGGNDP